MKTTEEYCPTHGHQQFYLTEGSLICPKCKPIPNLRMTIRTNFRWHEFLLRNQVPKRILLREFDWMVPDSCRDNAVATAQWCELKDDSQEYRDGFFEYHRTWYHVSMFMRLSEGSGLKRWDGYYNDSLSTGTLIKLSKDGEMYQIASFIA